MSINPSGAMLHKIRVDASACVAELLQTLLHASMRLESLRAQDSQGWTALHYAARSGLFSTLPWQLLGAEMEHVPINIRTHSGLSILQLAVWNEHATSVNMIIGS